MTYLIKTGKSGDSVWFDILGGSYLIMGVWIVF